MRKKRRCRACGLVGTKIAEPGGFMSASIHSSVSGKVAKIDNVVDASGLRKPAIFIDVEGDEWEPAIDRTDTLMLQNNKSREEIIECIKNAGVVGMGGACFPTHVKLCPPKDCTIDTLSEPFSMIRDIFCHEISSGR